MADALCGPSNPIQTFQKHTTVDRTLQQDRNFVRQSPSEGFRSDARANVGALDREFEAFEAGFNPLPVSPEFQQYRSVGQSGFGALDHRPQTVGWASDFQRLQISPSPPSIAQYRPTPRAAAQHGSRSWQSDYLRQSSQSPHQQLAASSMQQGYGGMTEGGLVTQGPLPNVALDSWVPSSIAQQKQPQTYEDEVFDKAAFERAFDAARSHIIAQEDTLAQHEESQVGKDTLREESDERLSQTDHLIEQHRIGADTVPWQDPEQQEESISNDDPDALARTAGQLLDSVKDDQSEKFRESNFLALMRRLRDKEVTVEGDKMVDVSSTLPAPQFLHLHNAPEDFITCQVFECFRG
ncbi:MAG: hypothetical protein M1812_001733 [Candelaria pacifica]|nr:MAG: hypothetical protein M1812_001733 [Candelaria pacifica]